MPAEPRYYSGALVEYRHFGSPRDMWWVVTTHIIDDLRRSCNNVGVILLQGLIDHCSGVWQKHTSQKFIWMTSLSKRTHNSGSHVTWVYFAQWWHTRETRCWIRCGGRQGITEGRHNKTEKHHTVRHRTGKHTFPRTTGTHTETLTHDRQRYINTHPPTGAHTVRVTRDRERHTYTRCKALTRWAWQWPTETRSHAPQSTLTVSMTVRGIAAHAHNHNLSAVRGCEEFARCESIAHTRQPWRRPQPHPPRLHRAPRHVQPTGYDCWKKWVPSIYLVFHLFTGSYEWIEIKYSGSTSAGHTGYTRSNVKL